MSEKICEECAVKCSERCPYNGDVPEIVQEYGCYRYAKPVPTFNDALKPTKCFNCRFRFDKRAGESEQPYVVCGRIASLVEKIAPIPNCPYFKPLRLKMKIRRTKKNSGNRYRADGGHKRYEPGGHKRYDGQGAYRK